MNIKNVICILVTYSSPATHLFTAHYRELRPRVGTKRSLKKKVEKHHDSTEIGSRERLKYIRRHDALRLASKYALKKVSERKANQYNKHRGDLEYKVGQVVLVRNRELLEAQAY